MKYNEELFEQFFNAESECLEAETQTFMFNPIVKGDIYTKFPYRRLLNRSEDMGVGSSNVSWMISIESELNKLRYPSSSSWSIIEVPSRLRRLREDAYTPVLVSIGPLHHSETSVLQAMKHHKIGYMQCLLNRTKDPQETLSKCTEAISSLEDKARSCYAYDSKVNSEALAKILLVDGCFIIELFIRYSMYTLHEWGKEHDPLFSNAWMVQTLQRDLSLLENQILEKTRSKLKHRESGRR